MEGTTGDHHKRRREEDEQEVDSPEISSPEAKRLLLDILDDDADAGDQDLASVMKSLEEEMALPSPHALPLVPPPLQPQVPVAVEQPDLGFLFEASDDELGLPPPAPSSSEAAAAAAAAEGAETMEEIEFGQIWGFDDINGYDGLEFGVRAETEAEGGVVVDGGLFDYADAALCGASDFADLAWRPETLPAV